MTERVPKSKANRPRLSVAKCLVESETGKRWRGVVPIYQNATKEVRKDVVQTANSNLSIKHIRTTVRTVRYDPARRRRRTLATLVVVLHVGTLELAKQLIFDVRKIGPVATKHAGEVNSDLFGKSS